jgi:hypothetical protein
MPVFSATCELEIRRTMFGGKKLSENPSQTRSREQWYSCYLSYVEAIDRLKLVWEKV